MKFELKVAQHASVVTLPIRMFMAHTPTYRAALVDYIDRGHTRLVIDMQHLEYIDSSGLSVLISARNQALNYQGNIVLLSPTPAVRSLIELTRLHHIFEIFETEKLALDFLRHSSIVEHSDFDKRVIADLAS
ncbi:MULTISPECIES: STAS domain-containing protein [Shewanella]|uniref:STAS domain-containing protein n=1 Tax=Shewanella TaxID=22 RepID=UPI001BBEF796|nr:MULTISPECIES: STAS domain-containing protein [Shewanella]GIU51199.1 hypothetical protein TUM4249_15010 [Shewanella sp. KT0246]